MEGTKGVGGLTIKEARDSKSWSAYAGRRVVGGSVDATVLTSSSGSGGKGGEDKTWKKFQSYKGEMALPPEVERLRVSLP